MNEQKCNFDRQTQPILSIIVPVYNVEKYLPECLDSLVNQDAPRECYEIICVDDGSPDKCGAILDDYQKNYPNLNVIHQANAGLAMARNAGLAIIQGLYIWFVDSDDFIPKYAVSRIVQSIKVNEADIYWIGMYRFFGNTVKYDDSDIEEYDSNIKLRSCYSVKSIRRIEFLKIYDLLFLDNNVPCLAEDYLLHFKVMKCKPKEGVVTEKPLYFYRYVNSSISNTLSKDSIINRVNIWLYVLEVQRGYYKTEKNEDRLMTTLEMQDSVRGILHWLSLIKDEYIDCFTKSFYKSYLPVLFSLRFRGIYAILRSFIYRRIVHSYCGSTKKLFRLYVSKRESRLIKKLRI